MKRVLIFSVFFIFSMFLIGFVIAEGNETNNQTQNNGTNSNQTTSCDSDNLNLCLDETNCTDAEGFWYDDLCNKEAQQNQTTSCEEDSDCNEGYECENDICILNVEDEEENEINDEDEIKVCCEKVHFQTSKATYTYLDKTNCISSRTYTEKIVDNDFCEREYIKDKQEAVREKNRIKFETRTGQECLEECTRNGVVMKCTLASGREMTIYTGSGNVIVQVKGINMSTNVTLYHHENKTYGVFKDNKTKEIKYFPDQVKEKVKTKAKLHNDEIEIELKEEGYKFKAKKQAKLLWLFKVREKFEGNVDPETGELTKLKNSWWGFLANDSK